MIRLELKDSVLKEKLAELLERYSVPLCREEQERAAAVISEGGDGRLALCGQDLKMAAQLNFPVKAGEILDRIRPFIHGLYQFKGEDISFSGFFLRPLSLDLLKQETGEVIKVTEKESAILQFLFSLKGAAAARDTLLKTVWGYADGIETHTIETHIYRLRHKLEDDPGAPCILVTAEDGYVLKI